MANVQDDSRNRYRLLQIDTTAALWEEDEFNASLFMKATDYSIIEMVHRADNATRKTFLFWENIRESAEPVL